MLEYMSTQYIWQNPVVCRVIAEELLLYHLQCLLNLNCNPLSRDYFVRSLSLKSDHGLHGEWPLLILVRLGPIRWHWILFWILRPVLYSLLKSRRVYSSLTGSVLGDAVVQISHLLLLKSNQYLIRHGRIYFLFWLLWNYCSLSVDVLLLFCYLSRRMCRLHEVGALIRIWMFEGPAVWFCFYTQLQSGLFFCMRGKPDWLPDGSWDEDAGCVRTWDNKHFVTIETEVCLVVVPGTVFYRSTASESGARWAYWLSRSVRAIRSQWTPSLSLAGHELTVRGCAFLWKVICFCVEVGQRLSLIGVTLILSQLSTKRSTFACEAESYVDCAGIVSSATLATASSWSIFVEFCWVT